MRSGGRGSRARGASRGGGAAAGSGGRSSSSGGGGGGGSSRGRGGRPPRSSPFSNAMRARGDTANDDNDSSLDDIEPPESIESILKQRKRHYKSSLREMDAIASVAKASSSQLTEAQVRIFFFFSSLFSSSRSNAREHKKNSKNNAHTKFTHAGILRAQASLVRRRFARTRTHRSETDRGYG